RAPGQVPRYGHTELTASGRTVEWTPRFNMRRAVRASGYRGHAEGVITILVLDVTLGVAALVFLIYRQLSARPVNASALRLIAVLLVIGLLQMIGRASC